MTMRDSISAARKSGPLPQADGANWFEFNFAASDATFAGHFPGRAILPGIFQLEIVRVAAEWIHGCKFSVSEVSKSKFQRPILPDEPVKLELKLSDAGGMISARADFSVNGQPAGETLLQLCRCE